MFAKKHKTLKQLQYSILLATLLLFSFVFLSTATASADTVTCNDGSVHAIPGTDYACIQPGEGGVRSIAPDGVNNPGEICPEGFPRSGQAIPEGQDGNWCSGSLGTFNTGAPTVSADECGENGVKISIDIGCRGQGNPIVDMLFAFIRFLSIGVGLVIVASIIVAGIQYTTSQGDPNATAKALGRVSSSAIALLIYIFAAALLNFVIPAGIFR